MKKQTWKSIFLSLIAIFTLFLLGACGQQSVQKSYLQGINQEKKTDVRITLEHKGDKAISNQTTTTIYYKEAGVTKDQLKNTKMSKDSHILLNTKMIIWSKKQL